MKLSIEREQDCWTVSRDGSLVGVYETRQEAASALRRISAEYASAEDGDPIVRAEPKSFGTVDLSIYQIV